MNIVVVSPHRDDAAFSLALAMMQWLAESHTITLLNCFTHTSYAPLSDVAWSHPNDRLSYVSAMRRREDELFLRSLPGAKAATVAMLDLNLKDAPLRRRCSELEVCSLDPDPQDPAIAKIGRALSRLQDQKRLDLLVLPLALGRHVDHLTVRNAALSFTQSHPSAFYEDLPYALRPGADQDLTAFCRQVEEQQQQSLVADIIHIPGGVRIKRRLVLGYASQIEEAEADQISGFAHRYGEGERLWCNPAWLARAPRGRRSSQPSALERSPA